MRTLSVLGFLCAALALAQPAGTGVISGTVVEASADTSASEPVRKAVVTVTWHGTPKAWATARTDGSGRFRFDGLPAGVYDLRATKPGIGVAIYGANSSRETGETITLADAETREGLKLRFFRSATISGTVLGTDGDPAANIQVMLLRTGRNNGQPILLNHRQAQTDDRGEYHLADIDPGQYYVLAQAPGMQITPGSDQVVTSQYYGGAREPKESTVLSIHDGDRLRGIDFALTTAPSVRIRLQVTGVPPQAEPDPPEGIEPDSSGPIIHRPRRGMARGFVRITVSLVTGFPVQFFEAGGGANPPDYRFESGPLPPAEYRVRAFTEIENQRYSASQIVDARSGSVETTLSLSPPVEVKGQIRIEGTPAAGQPSPSVSLTPVGPNGVARGVFGNENLGARVGADGKFVIEQVAPGEYSLNLNMIPRGGFLKSVRLGDEEVRFKPMEIKPGADAALNIVVSTHGGRIEGQVDSGDGDAGRAGILLTPVGEFHEFARFYYAVAADDQGKFRLMGIAPGKYKVFALEKLTTTSLRSPEAGDQLIALDGDYAQEIEVMEDGRVEAHPKLIPLERGRAIQP